MFFILVGLRMLTHPIPMFSALVTAADLGGAGEGPRQERQTTSPIGELIFRTWRAVVDEDSLDESCLLKIAQRLRKRPRRYLAERRPQVIEAAARRCQGMRKRQRPFLKADVLDFQALQRLH